MNNYDSKPLTYCLSECLAEYTKQLQSTKAKPGQSAALPDGFFQGTPVLDPAKLVNLQPVDNLRLVRDTLTKAAGQFSRQLNPQFLG